MMEVEKRAVVGLNLTLLGLQARRDKRYEAATHLAPQLPKAYLH